MAGKREAKMTRMGMWLMGLVVGLGLWGCEVRLQEPEKPTAEAEESGGVVLEPELTPAEERMLMRLQQVDMRLERIEAQITQLREDQNRRLAELVDHYQERTQAREGELARLEGLLKQQLTQAEERAQAIRSQIVAVREDEGDAAVGEGSTAADTRAMAPRVELPEVEDEAPGAAGKSVGDAAEVASKAAERDGEVGTAGRVILRLILVVVLLGAIFIFFRVFMSRWQEEELEGEDDHEVVNEDGVIRVSADAHKSWEEQTGQTGGEGEDADAEAEGEAGSEGEGKAEDEDERKE